MPFVFTNVLPNDSIKVLFKGLVVCSPQTDGSCELGIDNITNDHFLIIEIRARSANGNTDDLVMRHAGSLTKPFTLTVVDPPITPKVFKFQVADARLDRSVGPTTPHEHADFRWKIDLHDPDFFHPPGTLQPIATPLRPSVVLSNGTLYTEKLTDEIHPQVVAPGVGSPLKDLHRLALALGARISLATGQSLLVAGDDVPAGLKLPRPGDQPGTKYEISIVNEPTAIGTQPDPDELARYYDVLSLVGGASVPGNQRFHIEPGSAFKTDEIPCMPVVLGP